MTPLALALLAAVPCCVQVKPPPPPPELAATVQYSPTGDFGGWWQTYVVELDSRSKRELDLRIRIEDDSYLSVALRREPLAPGARKRVFLYAPAASFQRGLPARYRISDAEGAELASGTLPTATRGYAPQAVQVGLFCRIPAAEDDFGIPNSINSLEVRCGRFSAATFPDRWIGLASLDLLVIHDAPLDELTTDQGRALQDFVRRGGSVLLIPGPTQGWLAHPLLQSLAPVRTEPARSVQDAPGLAAAYGRLRGGDSFLLQPLLNGTPAFDRTRGEQLGRELVRFDSGAGRVSVLGVDLRRAPFDTWGGRRALWTDVVTQSPRWFQDDALAFPIASNPAQRDELFQRMGRLINPYPSFGLIFGLAIVFLGVVGPLNYAVLWKLRRTLLLVITVPGISVAFLAVIVLLGYLLKGTSTVAHSARLLSTRSGLEVARESHLYSLFSPATRTYDVSFEPGSYGPFDRWSTTEREVYRRRSEPMASIACETGAAFTIKGLSTGQWQSWDLESRALRDLGKGIRFSVSGRTLKVENGSSRVIERGIYVQTGPETGILPFAAVDAGKTLESPMTGLARTGADGLGLPPGSLGDTLLRPWLDALAGPFHGTSGSGPSQRFLICVLRDEGTPVSVDAGLSGRSRSVTLLHVAEAP